MPSQIAPSFIADKKAMTMVASLGSEAAMREPGTTPSLRSAFAPRVERSSNSAAV